MVTLVTIVVSRLEIFLPWDVTSPWTFERLLWRATIAFSCSELVSYTSKQGFSCKIFYVLLP